MTKREVKRQLAAAARTPLLGAIRASSAASAVLVAFLFLWQWASPGTENASVVTWIKLAAGGVAVATAAVLVIAATRHLKRVRGWRAAFAPTLLLLVCVVGFPTACKVLGASPMSVTWSLLLALLVTIIVLGIVVGRSRPTSA